MPPISRASYKERGFGSYFCIADVPRESSVLHLTRAHLFRSRRSARNGLTTMAQPIRRDKLKLSHVGSSHASSGMFALRRTPCLSFFPLQVCGKAHTNHQRWTLSALHRRKNKLPKIRCCEHILKVPATAPPADCSNPANPYPMRRSAISFKSSGDSRPPPPLHS
jgi:hypothetical protein